MLNRLNIRVYTDIDCLSYLDDSNHINSYNMSAGRWINHLRFGIRLNLKKII
jgi:hypothetical protein